MRNIEKSSLSFLVSVSCAALACGLSACGSDESVGGAHGGADGGSGSGGGVGGGGAATGGGVGGGTSSDMPPDLRYGSWVVEQLSEDDRNANWPSFILPASGPPVVAWPSHPGIAVRTFTDGAWQQEQLPPQSEGTSSYPQLAFSGGVMHLAYAEGQVDEHVFYRRKIEGTWEPPIDVSVEEDADWMKAGTVLTDAGGGAVLLGYRADREVHPNPPEMRYRLQRLAEGQPQGSVDLVIEITDTFCGPATAAVDQNDRAHLMVGCRAPGNRSARYITDAGGSWTTTELSMGQAEGFAALALQPDGRTVHLVWPSKEPGQDEITKYAPAVDGTVGETLDLMGLGYRNIIADRFGRAFVSGVWNGELHILVSEEGEAFEALRSVPIAGGTYPVHSVLRIDPETGLPQVVFDLRSEDSPLMKVMHAVYVVD